ncbi:DedA family protein [Streptomyces sp. NPDC058665]|uniref:DedA family protein n=1 Tax=Streptomyces sp. NPDC058665 TaxID=3346586 RepID=UPI0036622335
MIASSPEQWVNTLMDTLGAPGAGLAIALESVFPPLPSEVILPLAGFSAGAGKLNLAAAVLWTTAGSVVGALVLYWLGAWLGRDRTVTLASKVPLVKRRDLERADDWFGRHGRKAVLLGRMVPVFRSLVSVPAGVERMPLPTFVGLTALGSAIWNTAFIMAGYALGENWKKVSGHVATYSQLVLGVVALALVAFVIRRLIRSRNEKRRE